MTEGIKYHAMSYLLAKGVSEKDLGLSNLKIRATIGDGTLWTH